MKINNLDCCKPKRRYQTFSGESQNFNKPSKKILCKYFYETPKEDVYNHSVARAAKKMQNSGKVRLYKALPLIGAAIAGASIALTQPGKLTRKLSEGLGFLVLTEIGRQSALFANETYDKSAQKVQNKDEAKQEFKKDVIKSGIYIASTAAAITAGVCAIKGGEKFLSKFAPNVKALISKDSQKLKNEINSSKLAQKLENKVDPFFKKHDVLSQVIPTATVIGAAMGIDAGQEKLAYDIKKDFYGNIQTEYKKARLSQKEARAKYDRVDAMELEPVIITRQ